MGGLSGNKSKNNSTNEFMQSLAPEWRDAYSGLMNQLGYGTGMAAQQTENMVPGAIQNVGNNINRSMPAQGQQLGGGAKFNQDLMSQYMKGQNAGPSAESQINASIMGGEGNNYVDALKNTMQTDANYARNNMLSAMDARAVGAGQSGSSRHGVAQGIGNTEIDKNLMRNTANLGYQSFDKDLDRKLGIAQRADTNQAANMRGLEDLMKGQMGANNSAQQYGLGNTGNINSQIAGMLGLPSAGLQPYGEAKGIMGGPIKLSKGSGSGSGSGKGGGASVGGKG